MSLDSAIAHFRAAELALFRSTCTITRTTGRTFDEDTGTYEDETTEVYAGICMVRRRRDGSDVDSGSTERRTQRLTLKVPVGTDAVMDDVVEIVSSPNEALVGKRCRIIEPIDDDWRVSGHYAIEAVS